MKSRPRPSEREEAGCKLFLMFIAMRAANALIVLNSTVMEFITVGLSYHSYRYPGRPLKRAPSRVSLSYV